ncbi:MAG: hypothetical protein EF813_06305 [Methanosarcinales archaeon]|nr:MAG: hypothetical protein EF813_06305 [Methanosarcinales archaeon]
MTGWVLILIAAMISYILLAYLEHKKKIDMIDRGLWKPEERKEKPEHRLISGIFFLLLGVALLICSYSAEPDLTGGLKISGMLTIAAGITLVAAYIIGKKSHTAV